MEYGCIGEKLVHSFSADIHSQLFDYKYELKELSPDKLKNFLTDKNFKAINVTIPYKEAVIPFLDEISQIGKEIGAVNTIVNHNGVLKGYNTDFLGMKALIKHNNIHIEGKNVLIAGSGGTSKTALAVAKSLGCKNAVRVSRSKAEGCITYEETLECKDTNIIINTTPCGMYPNLNSIAISPLSFPNLEAVVDVVYNPLRTRLICECNAMGVKAVGGLYMLVAQAAFAAEKFIDASVSKETIDKIYNNIVREKENIVLTGMPACGKTTIGKQLSKLLNMELIDTDKLIEEKEKMSISDIFDKKGEKYFRKLESEVIAEIAPHQSKIISTGGGAVLNQENILALKQNGRIFFLDRPLESLMPSNDRPLSSDVESLKKRYTERYGIYLSSCDIHITSNGSIEQTVDTIVKELKNENSCN